MRCLVSRFRWLTLALLSLALVPYAFAATGGGVEARLVSTDGDARVSVSINTAGVTQVKVVAFDEIGTPLGQYSVEPSYYTGDSCADVSIDLPGEVDRQVHSVRLVAYTAATDGKNALAFDSGLLHATPMTGCASFCMAARQECSWSCTSGSGEAVFSCGPDGAGGCTYTCRCCEYPDCNGP